MERLFNGSIDDMRARLADLQQKAAIAHAARGTRKRPAGPVFSSSCAPSSTCAACEASAIVTAWM
jgi:hypothetical protein